MSIDHEIPFLHWMGVTVAEWDRSHVLLRMPVSGHNLNRAGVVHGGIYALLADAAGGLAGCYSEDAQARVTAYTLSLTTSFLGKVSAGSLHARGTLRRAGRQVDFSTIEITSDEGELLTLGEGSFLYRRPDGAGPVVRSTNNTERDQT